MNKKGISLIVKILLGFPLLLTILGAVNYISIGLTRAGFIGVISSSPTIAFMIYTIVGIAGIISSIVLLLRIIKE